MEFMNCSAMNSTIPDYTPSELAFLRIGILEISLLSCHFAFGLLTNVCVIWLIITRTRSGVASEFFNLNLSVCGILFALDSLFNILGLTQKIPFIITLTVFFHALGMAGHPLFQCLMCVERYLAVVHPVTFLKYKPLRYRVICCTVAWIITLGSCLFSLLSKDNAYLWFLSIHLIVVFFIELFCCLAVLKALKQSGPGERRRQREKENRTKRRAFYLILFTTMNLAIMYLPCTIVGLITVLTQQNIPALWYISFICFTLANFVQPVLYLHRTEKLFCICSSKNSKCD